MLELDMTIRDAQAEVVRAACVDGLLIFKSGTGQALATVFLGSAPFSAAANGMIELVAPVTDIVTFSGTAVTFDIYTVGLGAHVMTGSVGVTAGDLLVSDTAFNLGDTISIDYLAYVAPGA